MIDEEHKQQEVGRKREREKDSQHEVLLPARLVSPHCDRRALNILYLQTHVRVKLFYGEEHMEVTYNNKCTHMHTHTHSHFVRVMSSNDGNAGVESIFTHLGVHRAWLSSLQNRKTKNQSIHSLMLYLFFLFFLPQI